MLIITLTKNIYVNNNYQQQYLMNNVPETNTLKFIDNKSHWQHLTAHVGNKLTINNNNTPDDRPAWMNDWRVKYGNSFETLSTTLMCAPNNLMDLGYWKDADDASVNHKSVDSYHEKIKSYPERPYIFD